MRRSVSASVVAGLLTAVVVTGNGTAAGSTAAFPSLPAPPMGWNSWNRFACDVDEELIRQTADALVSTGMRDAGYTHVNLDDCWMARERDAEGRLVPDPEKFPSGMKALADHVHERGLKFGIYSSAGTATCAGYPASLDHEEIDARTFAEWGVDYLKYDNCYNEGRPAALRYAKMGQALRDTGRPIVFSICEWGDEKPWEGWGGEVGGHLWRTTHDIRDTWASWTDLLDQQVGLEGYSGPDRWNDPDMLEVGNGGMLDHEYRAHFSLWALLNAPLIAGNDLRDVSGATKEILLNRDLIAVNQDWGGKQGHRVRDDGEQEVWAKPMSDGSVAVVLFNRGPSTVDIAVGTADVGLPAAGRYRVLDLWSKQEGTTAGELRAPVPAYSVVAQRVWTA
jgi:alpha-galactosidase